MPKILKKYIHPFMGRILFWNAVLLILVKVVLPQSTFQLASIIDSIPVFDSRDIITMTNESRSAQNLPPLKSNSKLDLAAEDKLEDMATKEYFAHISPEGVTPWFWIKKSEYKYTVAGENLAIGFFTAKETVEAWLNSPSHRANILNNKYQDIGVAVKGVEIENQKGILVVQMFGVSSPQANQPVNPAVIASNPNPVPSSTPKPKTIVATPTAVALSPQAQGESTTSAISTDIQIGKVKSPISVDLKNTESITKWSGLFNNIYTFYSLIIAILSVFTFFLFEKNRLTTLKVGLNIGLFILAVALPVSQISFQGLIF